MVPGKQVLHGEVEVGELVRVDFEGRGVYTGRVLHEGVLHDPSDVGCSIHICVCVCGGRGGGERDYTSGT